MSLPLAAASKTYRLMACNGWLAGLVVVAGCATLKVESSAHVAQQTTPATAAAGLDSWKLLRPSNDRDWVPELAVLAYAEFHGDEVTVHNIRNCTYTSSEDCTVDYYDKTLDLRDLNSVDFIMIPFPDMPGVGHTMLSFGFGGRDYVAVSVEIRREKGEQYGPLPGFFNQYELMYVVADERDVIRRRTDHDLNDVYLYRAKAKPEQVRTLFVDVMQRVNKLRHEPEFYNTLTNNCTTNLRNHINRLAPDRIPYDYRVLLPGYSDELAYDLDLLDTDRSFEQTRMDARVNYLAYLYHDAPDFSQKIRR